VDAAASAADAVAEEDRTTLAPGRWLRVVSVLHSVAAMCFDKICMMTTRLACNRAIESSYWRMDNNLDVGLLTGYVLYRLPIELEFMDLDTFSR
jgi:hypothetical protein